jgi:hypothetical protein
MLFPVGTFGLNFPIFISTMGVRVFHTGAGGYGLLSSIMAIGTMSGVLLAVGREKPRFMALLGDDLTGRFPFVPPDGPRADLRRSSKK